MQEGEWGMTKRTDPRPATVPFAATPAGQPPSIQEWANRSVWTDRMLAALEQGVRGGRWHTLSDKVYQPDNLLLASSRVLGNEGAAGVDGQTVKQFEAQHLEELQRLKEDLRTEVYRPQAVQRVWIPKHGSTDQRPLGIPMVRAYCTPYQKPWGSIPHRFGGGEVAVCFLPRPPQASIASAAHLDDLFFQRRGTGFRNRVMSSGVSRTHHGPWGAACMPSRRPD